MAQVVDILSSIGMGFPNTSQAGGGIPQYLDRLHLAQTKSNMKSV